MHIKSLFFIFWMFTSTLFAPTLTCATSQQPQSSHVTHAVRPVVDVNHATIQQLQSIKGIGPKRAQAIIAYREEHHGVAQIDELKRIKGIGKKLFNKIKKSITV